MRDIQLIENTSDIIAFTFASTSIRIKANSSIIAMYKTILTEHARLAESVVYDNLTPTLRGRIPTAKFLANPSILYLCLRNNNYTPRYVKSVTTELPTKAKARMLPSYVQYKMLQELEGFSFL